MPTKQWLQVEVGNEIVMYLLLSFISSLDFKPLFLPIDENSGRVYLGCFVKVPLNPKPSFGSSNILFI